MIEYKTVNLSDIHEDPANARLHPDENLADIRASLKEFGQVEPLIVHKATGKVIGGNGRLKVMRSLGWEECDVALVDMNDMKATALGIALNRAGERAEWDIKVLAQLMDGLDGLNDELEKSLQELSKECKIEEEPAGDADAESQVDKAAELQKKWQTAQCQLWLIGEHRLLCGDSTKREDVERVLAGNKPLLMVTDPPYGVEYAPEWRNEALGEANSSVGLVVNDDRVDWSEAYKLFDAQVCYIWHADRHARCVQQSLEDSGYEMVSQIIWAKQHFALSIGDYHWQHEPCWYCVKKGQKHNWQGARDQSTLWEINNGLSQGGGDSEPKTGHGTQKPVECMARPIRNNTAVGDIVAEPFSGSGTTFVAAQNLHRKCYGIEISPAYCAVILERMKTAFPTLEIRLAE